MKLLKKRRQPAKIRREMAALVQSVSILVAKGVVAFGTGRCDLLAMSLDTMPADVRDNFVRNLMRYAKLKMYLKQRRMVPKKGESRHQTMPIFSIYREGNLVCTVTTDADEKVTYI